MRARHRPARARAHPLPAQLPYCTQFAGQPLPGARPCQFLDEIETYTSQERAVTILTRIQALSEVGGPAPQGGPPSGLMRLAAHRPASAASPR